KGGHMHLFDPDVNFACSGIIAEGVPPAVGAALAAKKRNSDAVAVSYVGEGAIDQGGFLESLNLAAVQNLPVVFVIEDNDWAISMPKERVTDVADGSRRADGFEMPGERIDHNDPVAVYEAAERAVGRAREGNGPSLIEVQVHRRMGHFMGDAQAYRQDEEIEKLDELDPIPKMEDRLRAAGLDDERIENLHDAATERVEEAIEWAKDQPQPDPEEAYEDVFTNPPEGPAAAETGGDD
ncbi:thiamine pyrophosphate-dependent dehydrogenase E1 component subunit alpha, partial [Natronomonas sp.]